MSEQTPNLKLTGKDLINIGIFSAIYFVLSFIGMFLAIIPVLWIIMPGIIAILAGIPFMLLCAFTHGPDYRSALLCYRTIYNGYPCNICNRLCIV